MFRDRARRPHAASVVTAPALVPGLVLALLVALAGCGSDTDEDQAAGPSKAALACRAKWKDLERKVAGRDSQTNPSALAQRWNNVTATLDYYARSASAEGCGQAIDDQQQAMDALVAFGTKLAPYDMELSLEQVGPGAKTYAAAPRPPAPAPSPTKGKKAKKQKAKPNPAPRPRDIAAALKTLTQQAPAATEQQGPAWRQASVVELTDTAAVAKAVKDLAFLSSESAAYRASAAARTQIQTALLAAAGQ